MKTFSLLSAFIVLSFVLASFIAPKANTISVYINGKTIPDNTVLTYEQTPTGLVISAKIPTGARYSQLTCVVPSTEEGNYPVTADSKAKITYIPSLGTAFNSQGLDNAKGFIKVVSNKGDGGLRIEFECNMANKGHKLALKTGKVQVSLE